MSAQIERQKPDEVQWVEINEQHLSATIHWIRMKLQKPVQSADDKKPPAPESEAIERVRQEILNLENFDPPPALNLLSSALGLSNFDQQVLALCTAMELDTGIASLCAKAQNDLNRAYPTFALAFVLFDDPDWNALSPHAPLRHWRLLEINQPGVQPLTGAALGVDERILNYLKGINYLDDRLTPFLNSMNVDPIDETLPASQQQVVDRITERLKRPNNTEKIPVIELYGHDAASKRLIAGRVAIELGLILQTIDLKTLPGQASDFETFTRLWERDSMLLPLALYIEIGGANDTEKHLLKRFLQRSSGIVFVERDDSRIDIVRNHFSVEINKPTPEEQDQLWSQALPDQTNGLSQQLSEQFSFSQTEINDLATMTSDGLAKKEPTSNKDLWQRCRIMARAEMEQLARRIDAKADWNQLVLPAEQSALLHQITDQVAQRNRVYEEWGFRKQMNRGLGINALFSGESGTGKTMAAEVIANALNLDLYRIDLSSVVSKYIGETEKNLRKLFDVAEDSGAILFFDEADALFGKRSEVKDSHDRYANIEINYLLQRMESFRGLAILASNMKSSLDKAFVRRLRFIVDFPFPDAVQRQEIWGKVFPIQAPVGENFDYKRLAKFDLTGGSIHNVAMNAAFLAAQENSKITMPLILNAARVEYRKLERPVKESNFHWLDSRQA